MGGQGLDLHPYLMSLRERRAQTHDSVNAEILEEKAAALARVARRFEEALAALHALEAEPAADAGRRSELLDAAGEALWCFVVQREAMGQREHRHVMEAYRIPPEVRRRMRPRRR